MPTLYSFGNTANVSSNNFTTLYSSGAGVVTAQGAYGNANVVGLLAAGTDGGNTVGNIISSGNITALNFFGNIVGNLNVPGSNTEILFNNSGNAGASANLTFNSTTNILGVSGNITATGNVAGAFFLGNGSQLTGLPATYSNAQVAAYLASGTDSSNIITTANVTGGNFTTSGLITATGNITSASNISAVYFTGNGSQLTGIAGNYSNANVAAYLASGLDTANIITTANINANWLTGNSLEILGEGYINGNLDVAGGISAIGSLIRAGTVSTSKTYKSQQPVKDERPKDYTSSEQPIDKGNAPASRDIAKEIASSSPAKALREIGKLEAKFETQKVDNKPPVVKSKAPEPIQPIRANGKADLPLTANGEFHGTYQAWKAARKAGKIR